MKTSSQKTKKYKELGPAKLPGAIFCILKKKKNLPVADGTCSFIHFSDADTHFSLFRMWPIALNPLKSIPEYNWAGVYGKSVL